MQTPSALYQYLRKHLMAVARRSIQRGKKKYVQARNQGGGHLGQSNFQNIAILTFVEALKNKDEILYSNHF